MAALLLGLLVFGRSEYLDAYDSTGQIFLALALAGYSGLIAASSISPASRARAIPHAGAEDIEMKMQSSSASCFRPAHGMGRFPAVCRKRLEAEKPSTQPLDRHRNRRPLRQYPARPGRGAEPALLA